MLTNTPYIECLGGLSCVSPCQQIPPLHASKIHCNDGWPPSILGHCSVANCTTPSRFQRVSSKSIRCWIGWFFLGCLCLGIFFVDFFYDFCKLNRCFEFMHPHSLPRASQILCWILVGWPRKVIFWIDTPIHLDSPKEKKREPIYFNAAALFLLQTNELCLVGGFNPF